jgi:hypothetical protein
MTTLNALRMGNPHAIVQHFLKPKGFFSLMKNALLAIAALIVSTSLWSLQASITGNKVFGPGLATASMVDPNITVRLANPQFDCATEHYTLDVEFQSDISGKELFGMNVRFFYDDVVLELVDFRSFEGGYGVVAPNPPSNSYSATLGPAYFNFGGGSDYINGAIQLTNENLAPVIIPTSGWIKVFSICFNVDDPNADVNNFCPSVVWDLESNPANGGFLGGGEGVVMTIVNPNGGSQPVSEHVEQYNWNYSGNGTPPFGAPAQITCSSIACGPCSLLVTNLLDGGEGSLRAAVACAESGDTVVFDPSLANLTISITSTKILINKNLYVRSNVNPRIKISSSVSGLFEIAAGKTVEFKDLDITSGTSDANNSGAAFNNSGFLKLIGVKVFKNTALPAGQYLVRNKPTSTFTLFGNCFIELP